MESIRFLVEVMKLCSAASCVNAVFVMQCSPGFARRGAPVQGQPRAPQRQPWPRYPSSNLTVASDRCLCWHNSTRHEISKAVAAHVGRRLGVALGKRACIHSTGHLDAWNAEVVLNLLQIFETALVDSTLRCSPRCSPRTSDRASS
jgi:hypothetical protein